MFPGGNRGKERGRSVTKNQGAEHTQSYRWAEILMQSQAEAGSYAETCVLKCIQIYIHIYKTASQLLRLCTTRLLL